jgi:hypothetical protein
VVDPSSSTHIIVNMTIVIRSRGYLSADHANNCPKNTAMLQGIFKKAPLRSQKGLGMGRLTGSPIGGEEGRAFKREWEESAAAMPQPLSEESKELLRESYIVGYANLMITRTRKHASQAVTNIGKKKTGQINVRRACSFRFFLFHSNPPTGCVHEAFS